MLNQALGSRVQVRVGLAQAVDQDSEKCGRQQKGYVLSPATSIEFSHRRKHTGLMTRSALRARRSIRRLPAECRCTSGLLRLLTRILRKVGVGRKGACSDA